MSKVSSMCCQHLACMGRPHDQILANRSDHRLNRQRKVARKCARALRERFGRPGQGLKIDAARFADVERDDLRARVELRRGLS